jgi:hypothetical protein
VINSLVLGAIVLGLLVWLGKGLAPKGSSGAWRIVSGTAALVVLAAAAFIIIRGGYLKGLPLLALAGGLLLAARGPLKHDKGKARKPPPPPPRSAGMSDADARAMLGVSPGAGRAEIEEAYKRLMKRVHPDQGGAAGLAAQLNAARDVLLRR